MKWSPLFLFGLHLASAAAETASHENMQKRLAPFKYTPFPLGSITATGWLHDQLQLEANGQAGHLYDFYRYVADSTWVGGDWEYSELDEAAPYWFNYIVPLAWTTNDSRLKAQAKDFLDYVLDHQAEDGWLGPETTRQTRGIWARSLLFMGFVQYAQVEPSETERIVSAMHRFTVLAHSMLKDNFTGLIQDETFEDNFDPFGFGLARTHELPMSLQWLYENHPRSNSDTIWETMELMFAGGVAGGRDWTAFFVEDVFPTLGTPFIKTSSFTHGVNLAQGLRYPTVLHRLNGNDSLLEQTALAVDLVTKYQSTLAGSITGDEHLGGRSPARGSETCMSVEMMFSMAYLYQFYGVNAYADRAERAAFNALPAALSPDWWSHQYVQQINQPWSRNLSANPFFNVNSYANSYGLEPNFPCCTVNHGQGYPKYVAASYVFDGDSHVIHSLLGPETLSTSLAGGEVTIACKTNYPFSGRLEYTITATTDISFSVRVPDLVNQTVSSNSLAEGKTKPLSLDSGNLQTFAVNQGTTTIIIDLRMDIHVTESETKGTTAIYYGPLLYALDIQYNSTQHSPLTYSSLDPLPADEILPETNDYVLTPTSDWRYAIDQTSVTVEDIYDRNEELPNPIWARNATPTALLVDAWLVPWEEDLGTAAVPPKYPNVTGEPTKIRLVPYGAAKLHIAEFPVAVRAS
ncbi:uncharacterized protein BDV14DRAFT_188040 [Aspergillus stella-maris]|uniref:uncharacterized protein n=1 Tax=Aspergillus stella-maris TaxID=1810926 RepID=UPI003CCCEBA4